MLQRTKTALLGIVRRTISVSCSGDAHGASGMDPGGRGSRTRIDPMTTQFDDVQKYGKDQMEQFSSSAAAVARGFQTIASETTDYSKRSLETTSSFMEKLVGVKSMETAIQMQSEFAKSQFEGFVAQMNKIGEIYKDIAKEAFRPMESALNKGRDVVSQQVQQH